jgi:hypothetical protein
VERACSNLHCVRLIVLIIIHMKKCRYSRHNIAIWSTLITSHFMRKVWNNANPQKIGKNHTCVSKLVLNYTRSSGMYSRKKCDRTVCEKLYSVSWNEFANTILMKVVAIIIFQIIISLSKFSAPLTLHMIASHSNLTLIPWVTMALLTPRDLIELNIAKTRLYVLLQEDKCSELRVSALPCCHYTHQQY